MTDGTRAKDDPVIAFQPLDETILDSSATGSEEEVVYAALIASVGYESRSRYVAERLHTRAARVVGFTFERHQVLSFGQNRRYFERIGEVVDVREGEYRSAIGGLVRNLAEAWGRSERIRWGGRSTAPLRIAIDLSSMTRQRIADTVLAVCFDSGAEIVVDWLYAPATYPGSGGDVGPVRVNEPVRGFEGWGDPALPLAFVFGSGFEGDLVFGVIDALEPSETWVFYAEGYSSRHDSELRLRNRSVFESLGGERLIRYRVDQPYETLVRVGSLVSTLCSESRVVLLPLGPKIFALLCFLVGASERRGVTVWRLSSDLDRKPVQRVASGDIVGLEVRCMPAKDEDAPPRTVGSPGV